MASCHVASSWQRSLARVRAKYWESVCMRISRPIDGQLKRGEEMLAGRDMDTSNPTVVCQCELLPMYVGRKVRPLSVFSHSDGVAIKGKSTDDRSLIIKGSLPSFPLSNFVEMHLRTTGYANLRMGSTKAYFSRLVNGPFFKVAVKQYVLIHLSRTSCIATDD
ncbi:hypothetical protein Scep_027437 [Stephania cephalantha]|uniref:Uncharacterized protein n=1 Tax=Stephania cephalantha TaxID=152367 RepID=A0AAP0EAB6_9MAGN